MYFKLFAALFASTFLLSNCGKSETNHQQQLNAITLKDSIPSNDTIHFKSLLAGKPGFDTVLYNALLLHLVHNKPNNKFPVKTAYPLPGAILPFKRVVTY